MNALGAIILVLIIMVVLSLSFQKVSEDKGTTGKEKPLPPQLSDIIQKQTKKCNENLKGVKYQNDQQLSRVKNKQEELEKSDAKLKKMQDLLNKTEKNSNTRINNLENQLKQCRKNQL